MYEKAKEGDGMESSEVAGSVNQSFKTGPKKLKKPILLRRSKNYGQV